MNFKAISLAAVFALGVSAQAQAASIIEEYDFTGTAGNQAFTAATNTAANITGSNLVRGAGLTANSGSGSLNSAGFTGQATDFLSFGFSVADGFSVNLEQLFIGTRSSNTGPGTLGLFYNGDNFASSLFTFSQSGTSNLFSIVDLSALTGLTGSVEFRILQIGTNSANGGATTSSTGTFRVQDYVVSSIDNNLRFTGTVNAVASVPVPAAFWLFGSAVAGFAARKRKLA